jgi:hypothetical protein
MPQRNASSEQNAACGIWNASRHSRSYSAKSAVWVQAGPAHRRRYSPTGAASARVSRCSYRGSWNARTGRSRPAAARVGQDAGPQAQRVGRPEHDQAADRLRVQGGRGPRDQPAVAGADDVAVRSPSARISPTTSADMV